MGHFGSVKKMSCKWSCISTVLNPPPGRCGHNNNHQVVTGGVKQIDDYTLEYVTDTTLEYVTDQGVKHEWSQTQIVDNKHIIRTIG